jgi:tetratricopeptide (TPR) repeat protein
MSHFRRSKLLVLIIILLPIVQSCAQMKSWISSENSVRTSTPVEDSSQASRQKLAQAASLAKKHMEAFEYQKALDVYNIEYRKHPNEQALVREYVKSLEDIKSAADKASDKEDFASAGRNYNVLVENYAHFKGFDKKLSFDSTHLNEKLCYCKKAISKQGFQEYRKGNLNGAIALWEDLIAIDPHNTDIKKSLRTAKLQHKNLEQNE